MPFGRLPVAAAYDAIILGQGLAGTALAWSLRWRGWRILCVDRDTAGTSSRVAAGLMTPITGQRLVKCWRWDDFWAAATAFYLRVEHESGATFFDPRPIVRLLASVEERERLAGRTGPEFTEIVTQPSPPIDRNWFDDGFGGFQMSVGGRLNVVAFLESSRLCFQADGQRITADLDLDRDIELTPAGVRLPRLGLQARYLIFCQGIDALGNPWFQNIRFKPAKGEILTLRIEGLAEQRIVSRGVWLMPIGDGLFRAGATYEWKELNGIPTERGRDEICRRLREFLRQPFEVVGHDAAVRPILRHQYPVAGLHPQHPQLGCINGLGSKGALQAPWLAGHLADSLAGNPQFDPAVGFEHYEFAANGPAQRRADREPRVPFTDQAQTSVRAVLQPGDIAIDATAGNGRDTLFLAESVGPAGRVYSFDIQSAALQQTAARLQAAGLTNVTLLHRSHAELSSALPRLEPGQVSAVMFNLGYLPGSDRQLTTQVDSTIAAIRDGLNLLKPGGVMTIVAYTGHPGGADEATAVEHHFHGLSPAEFDVQEAAQPTQGRRAAPRLFIVRRNPHRE